MRRGNVHFLSFAEVPDLFRTLLMGGLGLLLGMSDRPIAFLATHIHFLPVLRWLRWCIGSPYAGVMHGIEVWNLRQPSRIRALYEADLLISVSKYTANRVANHLSLDTNVIQILPNTFDEDRYIPGLKSSSLLKSFGLKPSDRVILTVGRLSSSEAYKGHDQVLRALPAVLKSIPDCKYLIAGDGEDRSRLEALVDELEIKHAVIFAGFVPAEQLPILYRLCDVFVMPSTGEGFGIVFLEALASGKPVIAGNIDASAEALDMGRLGALVDPMAPVEVGNAIISALAPQSSDNAFQYRRFLRTEVVRLFGKEKFASNVKKVIGALLSPPQAALPSSALDVRPCVTIVTQLTSPYQVELFNEIAKQNQCDLRVVYLFDRDVLRQWQDLPIYHKHIVISRSPWQKCAAEKWIENADFTIFTFYTDTFTIRNLNLRAASGRPWCFWGERPGVKQLGFVGAWFRRLWLRALHHSQAPIWGIGHFAVEGYRREFGCRRRYFDMPYYSDLRRFESSKMSKAPGVTFLFSGRLVRRKGIDLVMQAFAELRSRCSDVRLLIMGHGSHVNSIKEEAQREGSQISWLGFHDWPDLPEVYSQADYLIAPSRYDGWAMVIPEALAAGMPVIASDRMGAALEFIRHQENGWIVPAGDLKALEEAMFAAADLDKQEKAAMRQRAKASVVHHSLTNGAQRFSRLVTECLDKSTI
ncbi:MAG: glycosyltransferase [Nitrospira sp.]